MMIEAPMLSEEMSIDLNMLPGLLELKNCQTYILKIYPNSFPGRGENTVKGNWYQGLEKNFTYSNEEGLAPNQVELSGNYLKIL